MTENLQDPVFEKVKAIIKESLKLSGERAEMTLETDIREDLDADSLDVVDIQIALEEEFGYEIPEDDLSDIRTVGEVVNHVKANTPQTV